MAVLVLIPGALRPLAEGRDRVRLETPVRTAGEALEALWRRHPALRDRVLTERGELRPHVNVFIGSESVRHTGGLATPVADGSEIAIVPAVSGGSRRNGYFAWRVSR